MTKSMFNTKKGNQRDSLRQMEFNQTSSDAGNGQSAMGIHQTQGLGWRPGLQRASWVKGGDDESRHTMAHIRGTDFKRVQYGLLLDCLTELVWTCGLAWKLL